MASVINQTLGAWNKAGLWLARPLSGFFQRYFRAPIESVMFYNETTTRFCTDHPTIVALGICLVMYVIFLAGVHFCHELAIKTFGPTPFHVASAELKESKRAREAAAKLKKDQSTDEKPNNTTKTSKTTATVRSRKR